jgi:chemotaxis protein histidine kinase CheA
MAIDLSRFIATFFDETQEHLESIEERAMTLGRADPDPEILNAIFRAAHSIKGGAGTFGFTQLTETTHEMETLFDALRKGEGKADESTVRLLLDACDAFKAHIARLKGGEKSHDPKMDALRAQIIAYRAGRAQDEPAPGAGKPGGVQSAKGKARRSRRPRRWRPRNRSSPTMLLRQHRRRRRPSPRRAPPSASSTSPHPCPPTPAPRRGRKRARGPR